MLHLLVLLVTKVGIIRRTGRMTPHFSTKGPVASGNPLPANDRAASYEAGITGGSAHKVYF